MSVAPPERPSVLDTTVLSNFAYLDQVSVLRVLSRPVTVPAVRDELRAGQDSYPYLGRAIEALPETIPVVSVKYLGDKLRGFAVLSVPSRNGRMDAGEFNSPRPSRNGSAGINTRTPGASVRVGGSTPPDNTRLTCRSRVLRGVAFPRNCRQLLRIKVFNPRRNCTRQYGGLCNKRTAFTLGVKPRGTRPGPPVETVPEELNRKLIDRLDRGEAEAFGIAETRQGLLVTDDGAARKLARQRDVRYTGSIGVLVESVESDEIDASTADEWLKCLVDETGYRSPSRDISEFL